MGKNISKALHLLHFNVATNIPTHHKISTSAVTQPQNVSSNKAVLLIEMFIKLDVTLLRSTYSEVV